MQQKRFALAQPLLSVLVLVDFRQQHIPTNASVVAFRLGDAALPEPPIDAPCIGKTMLAVPRSPHFKRLTPRVQCARAVIRVDELSPIFQSFQRATEILPRLPVYELDLAARSRRVDKGGNTVRYPAKVLFRRVRLAFFADRSSRTGLVCDGGKLSQRLHDALIFPIEPPSIRMHNRPYRAHSFPRDIEGNDQALFCSGHDWLEGRITALGVPKQQSAIAIENVA